MAIAESFIYRRPNPAQAFDSFEKCAKDVEDSQYITMTVPAANACLPLTIAAERQQFTSADIFGDTVVCSGTLVKKGDSWGVLRADSKVSTDTGYAITGKFSLLCTAGATVTAGIDIYVVVATAKLTETAGGGADYLGKVIEVEVNPIGRPAGTYAIVWINQTEL
jgi:predicted RecA/RadA family phage recombinase